MTKIALQDGKVVMRDGKVGTEQACCCNKCECGPIDCTVTFSVDGVEFTWNITGYPNVIGDFAYAEQEFFLDPNENLCEDINNRYTAIKGFAYCDNGKHRIGIGIHMSASSDGECYRWDPDKFGPGDGGYVNVFYHKVKLHTIEVSACDCSDVTDLGVQNLEAFIDLNIPYSLAILAAMRGDFVSTTACGEICGDYEGPPEDCPEPPAVIFPVRQWPEACDPDNHTISDVSAECCGQYCGQGWIAYADGYPDESCVCPDVLGGGTHPGSGGAACDSCPTTPYYPFRCLSDAQAFAANYPEANWSYEPVPIDGFDPDTFCFPDAENCLYLDGNPLP